MLTVEILDNKKRYEKKIKLHVILASRDSKMTMVSSWSFFFFHAHTHNISLQPNLYQMVNIHSFIQQIFIQGQLCAIIKI